MVPRSVSGDFVVFMVFNDVVRFDFDTGVEIVLLWSSRFSAVSRLRFGPLLNFKVVLWFTSVLQFFHTLRTNVNGILIVYNLLLFLR